ncbi:Acyl-CoA dehydrogenase (fragment) [Cupriavidus necator]|uniref:Acyl-CoA dehydrogenase n=2 Tax=Cupriavidus necator TaxID=106590 RepID=A0A1K0IMT5_CUPNE
MVDYYIGKHMTCKLSLQEAAIAKLFATETLWKCIDDMVQLHGGYGYMLEYPIARAFVDMRVTRIFGGTSEVLRDLIARKL